MPVIFLITYMIGFYRLDSQIVVELRPKFIIKYP